MSLRHVYISHAGPDSPVATRLAEHLRNAGHDTKVDTLDLSVGHNVIAFMNDGVARAHTVIILLSRHLTDATWQRLEIDSAIWNEQAQNGGRCIVIRLDKSPLPPLLGPKVYFALDTADLTSMQRLVSSLCGDMAQSPTVSSIVAQALQRSSRNPFRHLRAEFFEDRPDLHAQAFAPPDALTSGALHEMKPSFLEGSRGCGKSMLLLSLRARNFILRSTDDHTKHSVFGFYLKLTRGAICNAGFPPSVLTAVNEQTHALAGQLRDLTEQELIVQAVESLFSELSYCESAGLVKADRATMNHLAQQAAKQLFEDAVPPEMSTEGLLDRLADTHKHLAAYIRRRFIYGESPSLPVATFDLLQLQRVVALVRRHIPSLARSLFVVLLDEYENLMAYQQEVVNTFVKLAPPAFSIKVAKKLASADTSATTTGQELQETHDYSRVPLIYDVDDPSARARYNRLLEHMVRNLCACEGIAGVSAASLLPEDVSAEVPEELLLQEIAKLAKLTPSVLSQLPATARKDKITYYREAATYRVLLSGPRRHADKRFSGFSELAFVSSGVIRYFQEILGVAYHLTYGAEQPPPGPLILPPDKQSQATHFISQHNLTTLSRNVEKHGEQLKYFLLDLGDCLRYKLLKHTSEPEAARLTIEDPELLAIDDMLPLRQLLSIGMREGVFQTKEGLPAFKPKHSSDPQPSEFSLSRIFAPVLQISPRLRWRTTVGCSMLLALARPGSRATAMQQLKLVLVRPREDDPHQIPLSWQETR